MKRLIIFFCIILVVLLLGVFWLSASQVHPATVQQIDLSPALGQVQEELLSLMSSTIPLTGNSPNVGPQEGVMAAIQQRVPFHVYFPDFVLPTGYTIATGTNTHAPADSAFYRIDGPSGIVAIVINQAAVGSLSGTELYRPDELSYGSSTVTTVEADGQTAYAAVTPGASNLIPFTLLLFTREGVVIQLSTPDAIVDPRLLVQFATDMD